MDSFGRFTEITEESQRKKEKSFFMQRTRDKKREW
jgi:hypothetical protein